MSNTYIEDYDLHRTDVRISEIFDAEINSFCIEMTIQNQGNEAAVVELDGIRQLKAVRDAIDIYLQAKAGKYFGIEDDGEDVSFAAESPAEV